MIRAERVQARIDYDPVEGTFYWSDHPDNKFPGRQTGTVGPHGYRVISYRGTQLRCSRIAFACITGEWPEFDIDHKNRDTIDDRWENLREATESQNLANAKLRETNTSGAKGVSWFARDGKWHVRVGTTHIGYFDDFDEAVIARDRVAYERYGDFAFLNHQGTSL